MTTLTSHFVDAAAETLHSLGQHGGLVSPSIYDTAVVARLLPNRPIDPATADWLAAQQGADGGWGELAAPLTRDVATLAAMLTLFTASPIDYAAAIAAGVAFLESTNWQWGDPLPEDIPGSVELLFPAMLHEAAQMGLPIDPAPYAALIRLGEHRRKVIARLPRVAGTTAAHAWEGWGQDASPDVIDRSGGVGHSPAATAAWLRASAGSPDTAALQAHAEQYLRAASAATETGVPGVVPTAWPIDRFEQVFALYPLLLAGLIRHPAIEPLIRPHLQAVAQALTPTGLGMSDHFQPDGDDTAVAVAVLAAAGIPFKPEVLDNFLRDDHFVTWPYELQSSLSVTAHAVHGMALAGRTPARAVDYLVQRQSPDGCWTGDKWNMSWLYTTSQVIVALHSAGHRRVVERGISSLLAAQHANGGWGITVPTAEETAYVVLAFEYLCENYPDMPALSRQLARGHAWLQASAEEASLPPRWLGKEPYTPPRVTRMFLLAALLKGTADDTAKLARVYGAA